MGHEKHLPEAIDGFILLQCLCTFATMLFDVRSVVCGDIADLIDWFCSVISL